MPREPTNFSMTSPKAVSLNNPIPKSEFQLGWIIIFGFILITTLYLLIGVGTIANYIFPFSVVLIGAILYRVAPHLYVGFAWWIVFLSPFIRRIADFKGGFTDPSPILLAPYLVALIPLPLLLKNAPLLMTKGGLPFVITMSGLGYSFLIALINRDFVSSAKGLLDWLAPVIFGFYIYTEWQNYPSFRRSTQISFSWGALLMGAYGLFQYLTAPDWDSAWINNTQFDAVAPGFSAPAPLGIRVFSTLNSQEPFSAVMVGCLINSLHSSSVLHMSGFVLGFMSLLLSWSRSSWIALAISVSLYLYSSKSLVQMRLAATILFLFAIIFPVASSEQFSGLVEGRLQSLTNLSEDGSATGRSEAFSGNLNDALMSFVGGGIGGSTYDNSILAFLFNLGWMGTIPYIIGLSMLLFKIFSAHPRSNPFLGVVRAVIISGIVRIPVNSPMLEAGGIMLWGFIGLGIAGITHDAFGRRHDLKIFS